MISASQNFKFRLVNNLIFYRGMTVELHSGEDNLITSFKVELFCLNQYYCDVGSPMVSASVLEMIHSNEV